MSDSGIDIHYIANLARIELSPEEAETFSPQLERVVDYVAQLESVDISSVPEHPVDPSLPTNVLREDSNRPSLSPDQALHNAPDQNDGEFRMAVIVE